MTVGTLSMELPSRKDVEDEEATATEGALESSGRGSPAGAPEVVEDDKSASARGSGADGKTKAGSQKTPQRMPSETLASISADATRPDKLSLSQMPEDLKPGLSLLNAASSRGSTLADAGKDAKRGASDAADNQQEPDGASPVKKRRRSGTFTV